MTAVNLPYFVQPGYAEARQALEAYEAMQPPQAVRRTFRLFRRPSFLRQWFRWITL